MTLTPVEFIAIEPHLWRRSVDDLDVRHCLDEIVRLRTELAKAREIVRETQWSDHDYAYNRMLCIECSASQSNGLHKEFCSIGKFLNPSAPSKQ